MNPLCCIAPVSIDRENGDAGGVVGGILEPPNGEDRHRGGRNSNASSVGKQQLVVGRRSEVVAPETTVIDVGDLSSTVAGLMYKWVNYGKGWRGRWFVLEDGVLSYYKFHGQDRVVFGAEGCKGVRVIGEESARLMRKASFGKFGSGWEGKPFGEIHLKVSSIRASNSDDKKLSIFSGTKTLHLRCESSEDRTSWFAALLTAKDALPRAITSSDSLTAKESTISTDKLRCRLLKGGVNVAVIRDCESIMLSELLDLQDRLWSLEQKYFVLVDKLTQLEADKVELETTVVSESKDRDIGIVNGRCSGKSSS